MISIGIVDDNLTVLRQMHLLLERAGFGDIQAHQDPLRALAAFRLKPPGVLLLDYQMPGLDGVQLLGLLQQSGSVAHTPVAMVSGCADLESMRMPAYRAGAHEVIAKPVNPQEFALKVRNLTRLAAMPAFAAAGPGFQALTVPRSGTAPRLEVGPQDAVLQRLLEKVAVFRDERTGKHTTRMAQYAATIGHHHGLSLAQQDLLLGAAPLHDIGKIGLPDSALAMPAALSEVDRARMQSHTTIGYELLRDETSPLLQLGAEIALSHHERWDGGGYPLGLARHDIPLSGRIVALADFLDTLTTVRPFKPAWLIDKAALAIESDRGRRFDPALARSCLAGLETLRRIKRHFDGDESFVSRASTPC